KLLRDMQGCGLIDVQMHNHPDRWRVPSLMDLDNAYHTNAKHFGITAHGLERYHVDNLTYPDGRSLVYLEGHISLQLLEHKMVDPRLSKTVFNLVSGRSIRDITDQEWNDFYKLIHFDREHTPWRRVTEETFAPETPGIVEQLDSPIPQVRLRALSHLDSFDGPDDLSKRFLGRFVLDVDPRVKEIAISELRQTAEWEKYARRNHLPGESMLATQILAAVEARGAR
ncbi:MAG: hypothetical protein V1703_02205, partial [Candidatus Altiarchaeota archaeon]